MDDSRREFLQTIVVATGSLMTAAPTGAFAAAKASFPKGFHWGVSTAAHQIEGHNVNSDFWVLENLPNSSFKERSSDACDNYNRYEEDIALIRKFGLNAYRFSIEWARIEPDRGHFSNAELDHYKRVIAIVSHGVV